MGIDWFGEFLGQSNSQGVVRERERERERGLCVCVYNFNISRIRVKVRVSLDDLQRYFLF